MKIKEKAKWDLVALGEVMLRLDSGNKPVHTTRQFDEWEETQSTEMVR